LAFFLGIWLKKEDAAKDTDWNYLYITNKYSLKNNVALLKDSRWARWAVLLFLSLVMFASYFFDDQFTTIGHIFKES